MTDRTTVTVSKACALRVRAKVATLSAASGRRIRIRDAVENVLERWCASDSGVPQKMRKLINAEDD